MTAKVRIQAALAVVALAVSGGDAFAQSLGARVTEVRSGTVRFSYPSRPDVCGNGRGNVSIGRNTGSSSASNAGRTSSREWEEECEPGPVRVAVDLDRGEVVAVRSYVGGRWWGDADADLGPVGAKVASDWLLTLAERSDAKPAKEAIMPAMLAEGVEAWPRLLKLANDADRPRDVRNAAIFWVSQEASEKATAGLQAIVDDASGDREVRKSAVFSISRRPKDESVPALIRIARTHGDAEVRKAAIFWLGQSRDARAMAYFEEILSAR
ncbi:MAG: HEAT repeat domain-containing protein [Gemmatimonadaceae bacterium]